MDKSAVVARLREIASLLELSGGNKFKARAFARGARALEAVREPVGALVDEKRLEDLPGIGHAIARQIEELHRTGRSELLESLRAGLPSGVLELSQVSGVGLHALKLLHDELGIATVEDLKRAASEGRLRSVKGFGPKKEAKILDAIARYESKGASILLADGLRLGQELERELGELEGVASVHVVGSLRRFVELSSEVSILVVADDPAAAIERAAAMPRVSTVLEKTGASARLRLPDGTVVEVFACRPEQKAVFLAIATGSREHVAKLAARARERGLSFEPSGLLDAKGAPLPIADEPALYAAIGLSYVPPELREDLGEVEAAARGERWDDLVTFADVRGFVHCHTTWSDGKGTIEEMARAAEERGATFLTITDHSGSAHYARGLDVDRLKRQWDAIDEAQQNVRIKLLKGTEADILADGALDWPDEILERLDVVIASIHSRHRQDEAKMTERLLRAMRHPVFKIWGHPLGRLVASRPPIPCRVEEVLDALAESRGAIEINGDPHRLDLEPKWVRAARERNIPFVLSVDAHSVRELDNVRYAVGLARRAGVRRSEVLNARTAEGFARAVVPAS